MVSDVPVGLEKYVNDTDNWAARATLLFEPTLDMSWLLNAHGSRRDQLSTLGQSIGTAGNFCVDGEICTAYDNAMATLRGASGMVHPEQLVVPSKEEALDMPQLDSSAAFNARR